MFFPYRRKVYGGWYKLPYVEIDNEKVFLKDGQEMMRRSLYHVKWYFSMVDLNTGKGKAANQKNILRYVNWCTPEREKQYPTSFKVDFEGKPRENACYYRITRCPICAYCQKLGVSQLMPLLCELDEMMIGLQHGVLHRQYTIIFTHASIVDSEKKRFPRSRNCGRMKITE